MAQRIRDTTVTHPWLVAELGGKVVGYSYASKHSQRAAYRWTVDATIYVDQQARRSGVGRKLYAALGLAVTQHCQALLSGDPDRPFNLRYDASPG